MKRFHGQRQNTNESFNEVISERIPKRQYVGFQRLELCVFDFVTITTYGRKTL